MKLGQGSGGVGGGGGGGGDKRHWALEEDQTLWVITRKAEHRYLYFLVLSCQAPKKKIPKH